LNFDAPEARLHEVKATAAPVLPLFRSDGQARLLAEVFLHAPPSGLRLTQLAGRAGLAASTAHREANRLEAAGLLKSIRDGRHRRLVPNTDSPYYKELRSLLLKAFGPVDVLEENLAQVSGVKHAYVYGSWARRYRGENGEAPADLDLLVIGDPDLDAVYSACRRAEAALGLDVNPTVLSEAEWREGRSGFLRRIRENSLVAVLGDDG
jgi:predicted nucleotidyltransferase